MAVSLLRPSGAFRWVHCSYAPTLEALYPEAEDSEEAREGTAGHFYGTEVLEGRPAPVVGSPAPNGYPIDAAMIQGAQQWIDDVRATLAELPPAPATQFRVETKLRMHVTIHPANEGTPDSYALCPTARRIVIWDYKYGHRFVDPYCNWQITNYLAGILEENGLAAEEIADWRVSFRVVQPRSFHPSGTMRRWDTTGRAATAGFAKLRQAAADATRETNLTATTGEHCRDCPGRHACTAFAEVVGHAIDLSRQASRWEASPQVVGREMTEIKTAIARLEARLTGREEEAKAMIRAGQRVEGWEMGYVDSRERWTKPIEEVVTLGDLLGVDFRKPDAITPNQARAALKAIGVDGSVITSYREKPTGAAKLKPADPNAAAKAFGNEGPKLT